LVLPRGTVGGEEGSSLERDTGFGFGDPVRVKRGKRRGGDLYAGGCRGGEGG